MQKSEVKDLTVGSPMKLIWNGFLRVTMKVLNSYKLSKMTQESYICRKVR